MGAPTEWPLKLQEMHLVLQRSLMKSGIPDPEADRIAVAQVSDFSGHFGGMEIYVPMNVSADLAERDAEIWNAYTGRNKRALAEKYGVAERTIERVVERERKARQGTLFPLPDRKGPQDTGAEIG